MYIAQDANAKLFSLLIISRSQGCQNSFFQTTNFFFKKYQIGLESTKLIFTPIFFQKLISFVKQFILNFKKIFEFFFKKIFLCRNKVRNYVKKSKNATFLSKYQTFGPSSPKYQTKYQTHQSTKCLSKVPNFCDLVSKIPNLTSLCQTACRGQ